MPTYEYRCKDCGHTFDAYQSFTDDALTECPECKGALKKLFGNVGISFKGSGFYKTDSRAGVGGRRPPGHRRRARRRRGSSGADGERVVVDVVGLRLRLVLVVHGRLVRLVERLAPRRRRRAEAPVSTTGGTGTDHDDPVELAVIGGSGFTALLDDVEEVEVDTPWGPPSGPDSRSPTVGDRRVAFLPRHGPAHHLPPAPASRTGPTSGPCARWASPACSAPAPTGSLRPDVHPGDLVVVDQAIDRTWGRPDTYFDGPLVHHVSLADPYCPTLRSTLLDAARGGPLPVHDGGTVVVIQGPRFATRAESRLYREQGATVINMTQMPEAALARELGLCYAVGRARHRLRHRRRGRRRRRRR